MNKAAYEDFLSITKMDKRNFFEKKKEILHKTHTHNFSSFLFDVVLIIVVIISFENKGKKQIKQVK